MRKFIKLTKARTNTALVIDIDQIKSVEQVRDKTIDVKTRIVTDQEDWYVKEAYHTVVKRMEEVYNTLGY